MRRAVVRASPNVHFPKLAQGHNVGWGSVLRKRLPHHEASPGTHKPLQAPLPGRKEAHKVHPRPTPASAWGGVRKKKGFGVAGELGGEGRAAGMPSAAKPRIVNRQCGQAVVPSLLPLHKHP